MAKLGPDFDPNGYAPVAERIRLFYERFPLGRIVTELVNQTESEVVFKALVFRDATDDKPAATGWAAERQGDGEINLVACLENTETSAVGRALANLGFTATRQRPSAEEMEKAARVRARLSRADVSKPADRPAIPVRPVPSRIPSPMKSRTRYEPLSAAFADATLDALRLLASAERLGLGSSRAERLRERLRAGLSFRSIERLEFALRRWITRRSGGQ